MTESSPKNINYIFNYGTSEFVSEVFEAGDVEFKGQSGRKQFRGCKFLGDISLSVNSTHLRFRGCTFLGKVTIVTTGGLDFEECSSMFVDLDGGSVIYNKGFFSQGIIKCSSTNRISNVKNIEYIDIRPTSSCRVNIFDVTCEKFVCLSKSQAQIEIKSSVFGWLHFNSTQANSLTLKDVNASIELNAIRIKSLIIDFCQIISVNISNYVSGDNNHLTVLNSKIHDSLTIYRSNLGKAELTGVDLLGCKLNIEWSNIVNMELNNIQWPEDKLLFPNYTKRKSRREEKNIEKFSVQRESYRQLKSVSKKNNNNIDALGFYANEMKVYYPYARKKKSENKFDRFLLWVNKVVSNFGQSYLRPLLLLFLINLIAYICYIVFKGTWSWSVNDFERGLGKFVEMLNPIRKPYAGNGFLMFFDFCSRALNGFFIYHFVKASRKFGKI
jgi:hypothetical protein